MTKSDATDRIRRHLRTTAMLLRSLPEKDAKLLMQRYGIGEPEKSSKEIAKETRLTAGRLRTRLDIVHGDLAEMFTTVLHPEVGGPE